MALLFMDGFDKYGPVNSNGTNVVALLTAGEWTSSAATTNAIVAGLSATGQSYSSGSSGSITKTLSGNYARLIGGVRFSSTLVAVTGVQFYDGGSAQAGICFNTNGTIAVKNGFYTVGTILGTSTATVSANSTHYLEWDITFGNVGTGAYQLWLDGVSILSGTGDTTATANAFANGLGLNASSSGACTFDDLYLFDTTGTTNNAVLLTSPRIETTFPVSDSAVQFAVGAGILGTSIARATASTGPNANFLYLRRFVPGAACTLNSISGIPATTSAAANLRGVIYADSAGAPSTLMSSGMTVTGTTANTVITLPLTTPQSLTAGTAYWLGMMLDTTIGTWQYQDTLNSSVRASATFASGAPGTAPAMSGGQASLLWWGNLTSVTGNWYQVSQNPTNGAYDYVFDATVGHEDLYGFGPLSAPPASIYAVAVKANVAKSDTGTRALSVRMKSVAADSPGSVASIAPGISYGWAGSSFPVDPNTSAAWTNAALAAATAGVKIES